MSVDPVTANGNTGGNFNRYWYANNNPYKFTDPDGREAGGGYATGQYTMQVSSYEGVGTVADFLPVIGDIKGVVEAIQNPTFSNIAAAGVGFVPVVGDAAGKVIKNADNIADAAKAGSKLPKPPTGPGTVAKADRDPKRLFSPSEREAKRAEQGHQCGNGCGAKIDGSNSAGHHVERHADGGRTVPENHAEVCTDCHKKLHSGD